MGRTVNQIHYEKDGFLSPIRIIAPDQAAEHRACLERAETSFRPLHYLSKVHTILTSPKVLATHPRVLDIVEELIGPDIMLFDVTYIIKEAQSPAFVSWHQDLTYWGFDGDEQVSMWLALSEANTESGCMRMIPGSHKSGPAQHELRQDAANVLHRGQRIMDVDEDKALHLPLEAGEASFHHGWTLHASMPNRSADRRIGLNVQYITPRMKQTVNRNETALLVRGEDRFGHYRQDVPATSDLDPTALKRLEELDRARKATWDSA